MNYLSGQDQMLVVLQLHNWQTRNRAAFNRVQARCAHRMQFIFWD